MSESLPDHVLISRAPGLLESEVDGELVGLHVGSGTAYGFNRTATRIWGLLATPRTLGELRDALVAEFGVEPERCGRELRALVEELAADGLVSVDGGRPSR